MEGETLFGSLLRAKITTPIPSDRELSRERLIELMDACTSYRVTTVVAPAGYGKTTFLADWSRHARNRGWSVAWVHLDEDDDGFSFWEYLCASIAEVVGELDFSWLAQVDVALDSANPLWINKLINVLSKLEGELVLILDDYHLIRNENNHKLLAKLLEYMPRHMHVVISGRSAPPLPTARLLVRRELLELTARDLAFSRSETAAYLSHKMELELDPDDLAQLHGQTEGWITGIQIIALMMRSGLNPLDVLARYSGQDAGDLEGLFGYFAGEVVERQPDDIRLFLIHTSILHELSAELCNAVLDRSDSAAMIAEVEKAGLFITSMSDDRHWYRYHPLFSQCMRSMLAEEQPELSAGLHAAAADWLEKHGFFERAIPHVLECGDYRRLTDDFERICYADANISFLSPKALSVLRWVDYIPREELVHYPRLVMLIVIAEFHLAKGSELQNLLHELGGALKDSADLPDMQRKEILTVRSLVAYVEHDFTLSIQLAENALAVDNPDDIYFDGMLRYFISQAYLIEGNAQGAEEALILSVRNAQRRGFVNETISSLAAMARVRFAQGRGANAIELMEHALGLAHENSVSAKLVNFLTASIDSMRDLADAGMRLESFRVNKHGFIVGQMTEFEGWQYAPDFLMLIARHCLAYGTLDEAADLLARQRAIMAETITYPFLLERLELLELRLHFMRNELGEVQEWARRMRGELANRNAHARALQALNLARAYYMLGRINAAHELLNAELPDAGAIPLAEFKIEYYLLRSMTYRSMGSARFARSYFTQALALAEASADIMPFIEWGPILHPAFDDSEIGQDGAPAAGEFLAMLRKRCFTVWTEHDRVYDWTESADIPLLVESLSQREEEVLKLVMRGYAVKRISSELCISYNTARTHMQSIYRKLGVHNREEALEIARTLLM